MPLQVGCHICLYVDQIPKAWPCSQHSHLSTQQSFFLFNWVIFHFLDTPEFFYLTCLWLGGDTPRHPYKPKNAIGSLRNTGNESELTLPASNALNFTKSELWKRSLSGGTLDDRMGTGVVLRPLYWFPIPIPTFPVQWNGRGSPWQVKTSFGKPSINKALQNLCK